MPTTRKFPQQHIIEGPRAPQQRPVSRNSRMPEAHDLRSTAIILIVILAFLILIGIVLGLFSLVDAVKGHPGASWHALAGWIDSIKIWVFVGVGVFLLAKFGPGLLEMRMQTAIERAEAAAIREEIRYQRDIRHHNESVLEHHIEVVMLPNRQGNYAQISSGSYLPPGNNTVAPAGTSMQVVRELLALQQQQIVAAEEEEAPQLEGPSIDPRTVAAPTLEEDLAAGRILPGDPMLMGYRLVHDEFTQRWSIEPIIDPDDASMFICAASTAGKSTLVSMMMARMAARSDTVFVIIDPHMHNEEKSIMAKVMPALEPWLAYPVVNGKDAIDLKGVVRFLKSLITLREGPNTAAKQHHPLAGLKVRVVIDEAFILASITRQPKHDKVYDEFLLLMQEMGVGTAKSQVMFLGMAQLATKEQMGEVDIRDICPKTIILKAPKQSGLALNLPAKLANMAHYFPKGRGFYIGEADEPELFIWGNATPQGIAQVAAMSQSPLRKEDGETRSMVVNEENGFEALEMGWKEDGKRMGNQFPTALQAELEEIEDWTGKLRRLRPLFGGELTEVIYEVWGIRPGRGDRYQKARAEYDVLKAALQMRLRQED